MLERSLSMTAVIHYYNSNTLSQSVDHRPQRCCRGWHNLPKRYHLGTACKLSTLRQSSFLLLSQEAATLPVEFFAYSSFVVKTWALHAWWYLHRCWMAQSQHIQIGPQVRRRWRTEFIALTRRSVRTFALATFLVFHRSKYFKAAQYFHVLPAKHFLTEQWLVCCHNFSVGQDQVTSQANQAQWTQISCIQHGAVIIKQ